jgi:hypothetical protein
MLRQKHNSHVLVTCWSYDSLKSRNIFFRKFASEVLQRRNVVYSNKIYFLYFSTNINFFFKLLFEAFRGDSGLSLCEARILIFCVVETELSNAKMGSLAD